MVQIEIKGLNKLIKLTEKFPETAEKHVNGAIKTSLDLLKSIIRSNSPIGVSRNLREQWNVEMKRFQGKLKSLAVSGNGRSYGSDVEYGTDPHWVPISALIPWAEKKGINPWAVQKSIAKKGTKGQFFVEKSITYAQKTIDGLFKKATDDILKELNKTTD